MIWRRMTCAVLGGLLGGTFSLILSFFADSLDPEMTRNIGMVAGLLCGGLGMGRLIVVAFFGFLGSLAGGTVAYGALLGLDRLTNELSYMYGAADFIYSSVLAGGLAGIALGVWLILRVAKSGRSRWVQWL